MQTLPRNVIMVFLVLFQRVKKNGYIKSLIYFVKVKSGYLTCSIHIESRYIIIKMYVTKF
jgi:hypothetical protein